MSTPEDWIDANVPTTGEKAVEYCPRIGCGSPVVRGQMAEHDRRIHMQYVAPAGSVSPWIREW
jgi:hypothetical protein